jgi:prepilin-type processing-associated H-X9-DG protein
MERIMKLMRRLTRLHLLLVILAVTIGATLLLRSTNGPRWAYRPNPSAGPWIEMAAGSLNADGLHAADNYSWSGEDAATEADKALSRATGVFWLPDTDGFRVTIESINNGDGTGQTILMTENLNSGNLNTYVDGRIGGLIDPRAFGFGLGIADLGLSKDLTPGTLSPNFEKYWKINSNGGTSVGRFPVPSSMHPGVVNVAFCDGSARTVADKIDPRIYAALLTPRGVEYGEARIGDGAF